ncbi:response regulator transcription factor [Mesorhizobium sp. dw_380]|uniref:response regulator transcription factor n=1 Tax=Mesorhizobium sp. dw_380 TaxID=2812001 RepID=UPI001BDE7BF1|nr:response regulator transcription factor [Mesorhizobium sp. dw_380]
MRSRTDDTKPTVFIIDDDEAVRESLNGLFQSIGLRVELFASVQAFLSNGQADRPGCMVLDVRLPGQSGLDFQDLLVGKGIRRPIIFISGHADIPMTVRAMKAGAMEFLTKPVRSQDLLDAVQLAIERDQAQRARARNVAKVRADFESLTPREREIMALVATGRPNKQIAADVGLSEATVKLHRGHVMQKMNARSVAELVRMTDALDTLKVNPW